MLGWRFSNSFKTKYIHKDRPTHLFVKPVKEEVKQMVVCLIETPVAGHVLAAEDAAFLQLIAVLGHVQNVAKLEKK